MLRLVEAKFAISLFMLLLFILKKKIEAWEEKYNIGYVKGKEEKLDIKMNSGRKDKIVQGKKKN